jgi:hypothetical protein
MGKILVGISKHVTVSPAGMNLPEAIEDPPGFPLCYDLHIRECYGEIIVTCVTAVRLLRWLKSVTEKCRKRENAREGM